MFVRKERNKVYQRLLSSATELTDSAIHSVSGQRRSINIEQGYHRFVLLLEVLSRLLRLEMNRW